MRPSPQPGEPGEGRGVTFGQLTTKGKDPRTARNTRCRSMLSGGIGKEGKEVLSDVKFSQQL
jgi:hypothetical protein